MENSNSNNTFNETGISLRKHNFKKAGLLMAYPVAYLYWRLMLLDFGSDFTFVGPTIFTVIFIIWNEIVLRGHKEKAKKGTMFWYVAMVITSLLSTYSPNFFLSMFAVHLCAIYSVLYSNDNLLGGKTSGFIVLDIFNGMFMKGLANIGGVVVSGRVISKERKILKNPTGEVVDSTSKKEKTKSAAMGFLVLAIAFLFFVIVVSLLSSINAQFGEVISKILGMLSFDFDISEYVTNTIARMIFAIPVCLLLYGALSKCASTDGTSDRNDGAKILKSKEKLGIVSTLLVNIVLSCFVVLYIIFFIFEGSYIFGGLLGRIPEGFNVVSYARNGFFELIWVMAINMLLYFLVNTFNRKSTKSVVNKSLLISLMAASIIFAVVSFAKLCLYFGTFGYTPKRILAMWGAVVLAVGSAFVIASIIKAKSYARTWIIFAVVTYILMCIIGSGFNLYDRFSPKSQRNNDLVITITNRTDIDIYRANLSINTHDQYYDLGNCVNASSDEPLLRRGESTDFIIAPEDLPDNFYDNSYMLELSVYDEFEEPYYGYVSYSDGLYEIDIRSLDDNEASVTTLYK